MSVSPNPDQPLIAVIIQLNDADRRSQLRIYNYKTKQLKDIPNLNGNTNFRAVANVVIKHKYYPTITTTILMDIINNLYRVEK